MHGATTVQVWVHFPLHDQNERKRRFNYNMDVTSRNPLRFRKHRWTTIFHGVTPDETVVDHLSVLEFEDGLDEKYQMPMTGAQFGMTLAVAPGSPCTFRPFVNAAVQQQCKINQISDGWHMLTLVTAASDSAPLAQLYVDGRFWGETTARNTCPITAVGCVPAEGRDIPQNVKAISTVTVKRGFSSSASVMEAFSAASLPRKVLRSAERPYSQSSSTGDYNAPAVASTSAAAGPSSPFGHYVPRPEPSTSRRHGARPRAAAGSTSSSSRHRNN